MYEGSFANMLLALSSLITKIDKFSEEKLGMPVKDLMSRAGAAVARCVMNRVAKGASVVILCGKGNNGGDGYACAINLMNDYEVVCIDVFSAGQRSEEGKAFLASYKEKGGIVEPFDNNEHILSVIASADCIVDAIFGTGFSGECPPLILELSKMVNKACCVKVAIDIPLGINADNGCVNEDAVCAMTCTVALAYLKPGLVSFPAKAYVGEIIYDDLALDLNVISNTFEFKYKYVDPTLAKSLLPKREENSNKGSFGKLLCITGCSDYRGAARLSLEAALRGGVGMVCYAGCSELVSELSRSFPEAIYKTIKDTREMTEEDMVELVELSRKYSAVLVGSGSGNSKNLAALVKKLLSTEGGPLILDADALNALADNESKPTVVLREAKRKVVMTPHPLEFSRICGDDVSFIQLHRIEAAVKFAAENKVHLILKGAATISTDGNEVYVNSSGSSALAKAGSGDVLAGFVSALIASGVDCLRGMALAAFYHGAASDTLSLEYSKLGVTPSDLPKQIAREIAASLN